MKFLNAHELRRIVIIGAGELALAAAEFAQSHEIEFFVFAAPRQIDVTNLDGRRTVDAMSERGFAMQILDRISSGDPTPHDLGGDGSLLLSFGSPFILKQDLLDAYAGRAINCHNATLPKWRGGGSFSWRILSGDRNGRSCFHLITPEIDAGDIVVAENYTFPDDVRFPRDYHAFSVRHARDCLVDLLTGIYEGRSFELTKQNEANATYFPRLNTDVHGVIDWQWHGEEIERFVLAFSHPFPGAKTLFRDQTVRIFDARFRSDDQHDHSFFSGLICRIHGGELAAIVPGGLLMINESDMVASECPNVGDRFHSPAAWLDQALVSRSVYRPTGHRIS